LKRYSRWALFIVILTALGIAGTFVYIDVTRYSIFHKLFRKTVQQRIASLENDRPELRNLLPESATEITLLAFKKERRLELWADRHFIKSYPFTAFSGQLGPKLREGDRQIPEGCYPIESLNPNSAYHLSIKVGYPNESERAAARQEGRDHLGGDIFIHGKDVSVGCIALGDRAIEELFYVTGKQGIERCRIIIAPYDMRQGRDEPLEKPLLDAHPWLQAVYDEIAEKIREFRKE